MEEPVPSSPSSVQNLLQQHLTLERDRDLQKSKLRPRVYRPLGLIFPSKCPQLVRISLEKGRERVCLKVGLPVASSLEAWGCVGSSLRYLEQWGARAEDK